MYRSLLLVLLLLSSSKIYSQQGGEYIFNSGECITESQRQSIINELKEVYKANKKLFDTYLNTAPKNKLEGFDWPVVQIGRDEDPGFYGISNYVDHNDAISEDLTSLRDYNCGRRTYDVVGYNHQGTDIFTWPFPWLKMETNDVAVIAAKEGVVLTVRDGNYDRNCAFCTNCSWNAVYVLHNDGTVAWYGHLKNASIPSRLSSGVSVERGDILGIVASSGNSTGPHLHFELWSSTNYTNTVDPFKGPCNAISESYWSRQKAYREPRVNLITTGFDPPVDHDCDIPWEPNLSDQFYPGERVVYCIYLADEIPGESVLLRVFDPDGKLYDTWVHNSVYEYNASYWYWTRILPINIKEGNYRFEVVYMGSVYDHEFTVGGTSSSQEVQDQDIELRMASSGILSIKGMELDNSDAKLKIYSLDGKCLYDKRIYSSTIQVPWISSGLHLCVITDTDRIRYSALIPFIR